MSWKTLTTGVAAGACGAVVITLVGLSSAQTAKSETPAESRLTAEQARREVRMLDDLYKTAVIYINDNYVEDEGSVAAGEAARDLFAAMKQKGWHDARLIDATGNPVNEENRPEAGFEQAAIKRILAGEAYYDEIVREGDQSYLRAATLVPAVNQKCILCHPKSKVGDTLGAIGYKIPLK